MRSENILFLFLKKSTIYENKAKMLRTIKAHFQIAKLEIAEPFSFDNSRVNSFYWLLGNSRSILPRCHFFPVKLIRVFTTIRRSIHYPVFRSPILGKTCRSGLQVPTNNLEYGGKPLSCSMTRANDEYYTVSVALTTLGAWRTGFYRIAWGGIGHLHVVTTFCRNQQKQNRHNFIHYLKKPCQLLTCNWWIRYFLWLLHIFFFPL